jgi:hypothetical protein
VGPSRDGPSVGPVEWRHPTVALWNLALLVNVVIAVAYLAISIVIARGIHAGGQWRSNPLAVATALIFLTCAIGHAAHAEHLLLPSTT